jgi:hypothetical protein
MVSQQEDDNVLKKVKVDDGEPTRGQHGMRSSQVRI